MLIGQLSDMHLIKLYKVMISVVPSKLPLDTYVFLMRPGSNKPVYLEYIF